MTHRSDRESVLDRLCVWATTPGVDWIVWIALFAGLWFMLAMPGCADPRTEQNEGRAFNATERFLVHEANEVQAGRLSPGEFLAEMRKALDELQAAEQGERSSGGATWVEVLATALGSSGLVGGALHVLRNSTRKSQLDDLARNVEFRLRQVEAKGGAS